MYFKNLGTTFEKQHAAERRRFAEHLGPIKTWMAQHGWTVEEGREPCDLLFRRAQGGDGTLLFAGRYDGRQDLVLRLKLPLERVRGHEARVEAALAAHPTLTSRFFTHKDDAFVALTVKRSQWLGALASRESVERRLLEFVQAATEVVEAVLASVAV